MTDLAYRHLLLIAATANLLAAMINLALVVIQAARAKRDARADNENAVRRRGDGRRDRYSQKRER